MLDKWLFWFGIWFNFRLSKLNYTELWTIWTSEVILETSRASVHCKQPIFYFIFSRRALLFPGKLNQCILKWIFEYMNFASERKKKEARINPFSLLQYYTTSTQSISWMHNYVLHREIKCLRMLYDNRSQNCTVFPKAMLEMC